MSNKDYFRLYRQRRRAEGKDKPVRVGNTVTTERAVEKLICYPCKNRLHDQCTDCPCQHKEVLRIEAGNEIRENSAKSSRDGGDGLIPVPRDGGGTGSSGDRQP